MIDEEEEPDDREYEEFDGPEDDSYVAGSICPYCDGTGEHDFLSGAHCYNCRGSGLI